MAKIKTLLYFDPCYRHILKILEVGAAAAAAAVARVEVEQRNNFGCAADYLRLRSRVKKKLQNRHSPFFATPL